MNETPSPGESVVLKSRPITGKARVVEPGQRRGLWWLRFDDGREAQHHVWEFMKQQEIEP